MTDTRPPHAWLSGHCIAMIHMLPNGTWFNYDLERPEKIDVMDDAWRDGTDEPVFVVRWADGSTPEPPDTTEASAVVAALVDALEHADPPSYGIYAEALAVGRAFLREVQA